MQIQQMLEPEPEHGSKEHRKYAHTFLVARIIRCRITLFSTLLLHGFLPPSLDAFVT